MIKDILKELEELEALGVANHQRYLKGEKLSYGEYSKGDAVAFYPKASEVLEGLMMDEANERQSKAILSSIDTAEEYDIEYIRGGNTYNWNGNIDHDLNFDFYKWRNRFVMELQVHRYGDVRGNYTDKAFFIGDSVQELEGILFDAMSEASVFGSVVVDGVFYNVYVSITSETVEVSTKDDKESFEVCSIPEEEYLIEAIREHIKDEGKEGR